MGSDNIEEKPSILIVLDEGRVQEVASDHPELLGSVIIAESFTDEKDIPEEATVCETAFGPVAAYVYNSVSVLTKDDLFALTDGIPAEELSNSHNLDDDVGPEEVDEDD